MPPGRPTPHSPLLRARPVIALGRTGAGRGAPAAAAVAAVVLGVVAAVQVAGEEGAAAAFFARLAAAAGTGRATGADFVLKAADFSPLFFVIDKYKPNCSILLDKRKRYLILANIHQ